MGQKCSCINGKEESVYHFNQDGLKIEKEHIDPEHVKLFINNNNNKNNKNDKSDLITKEQNNYNSEDSTSSEKNNTQFENPKMAYKLITIQGIIKSFLYRLKFKQLKTKMQIEDQELIQNYLSQIQLIEIYTGKLKIPDYDPKGWIKYYTPGNNSNSYNDSIFNFDYGKVYSSHFIVYENDINLSFYKNNRNNTDSGNKNIDNITSIYIGQVNYLHRKHGFGKLINKDGSFMEGFWQNNEFTGWGRIVNFEGIKEGNFNIINNF
jgi:hypothetical protein